MRLIPLDPAGLPRVPGRSVAEGNAYRVDVTYAGSGAALSRRSVPAVLTLVAPSRASAMLRLQGTSWVPVPAVQLDEESRSGLVGRSEQLGTFVLVHRQSDAPISPDEAARASAETNQVPTTAPTVRTAAAATRARPADDPPGDEPVRLLLVLTGVVALTLLARLLRRRDG